MPVCLDGPGGAGAAVVLPVEAFTLAWTHSVEQTTWQEEWQVDGCRLRLVGAAVAGSGAGMEPGDGAVLRDGAWHWVPALDPVPRLWLARGRAEADEWRLCWEGTCRALASLLPAQASGPVSLYACEGHACEGHACYEHACDDAMKERAADRAGGCRQQRTRGGD